jgi:hypothetical protein
LPDTYNGVPNSLGWVLEEMDLEIEDTAVKKGLMGAAARAFKPFGSVKAAFHPANPARPPRFVVAEMKFGYHAKEGKPLTDKEWKGRLGTSDDGKQMSKKWINARLKDSLPEKYMQITGCYVRWLYGVQPVKAENSKRTKSKKGKLMGLAYFPPYALRGFDMDKLGW